MVDVGKEEAQQLRRRDFIVATAQAVKEEAEEAEQRMLKLEPRYVLALAEHRLGEFSNGKMDKLKKRLDDASTTVYRAPKILEGLKILECEAEERLKILSKGVQKVRLQERYDELKAQLEESFDKHAAMKMRQISDDLGIYWENEKFIQKLEQEWRSKPLSAL